MCSGAESCSDVVKWLSKGSLSSGLLWKKEELILIYEREKELLGACCQKLL